MARAELIEGQDSHHLAFRCPGCGHRHVMRVEGSQRPCWTWNGSLDQPTLQPSVLVTSGHYADPSVRPEDCCLCKRGSTACYRCHSYVRDGQIQFLGDSTHALADRTVPLPEIVEEA